MNKNSFTSVGKTSFCVCASETNTETRRDKKLHFKNKKKKKKRIESYELVATHWFLHQTHVRSYSKLSWPNSKIHPFYANTTNCTQNQFHCVDYTFFSKCSNTVITAGLCFQMGFFVVDEDPDLQEMPQIPHHRKGLLGSLTNAAAAEAAFAVGR